MTLNVHQAVDLWYGEAIKAEAEISHLRGEIEGHMETIKSMSGWLDEYRAINAELVEALLPFAIMADQVDEWQKGSSQFEGHFNAKDLGKARAAVTKAKEIGHER